jgi:hypothetical protein
MSRPVMTPSLAPRRHAARSGRRAALALVRGAVRSWIAPSAPLALIAALALGGIPLPAWAASSTSDGAERAESGTPALPRQFSVEVARGGVLFADGTRLGARSELERWAQRALAGSRFAGAVVFGDEEHDAAAITEAMDVLRRVGFEVRRAARPAPAELSAARTPGLTPVVTAGRAPPLVSPVSSAPRPPTVTLASVGLHVDGTLNREPHRGRLLRVFEREFNAFRRCHERAEKHAQGASFGVDLLIPKSGGRATLRQTRTRLTSKAFRTCMHGAFEAIRFAPPPSGRAEIVSYSVLFKPSGP